jgi:large subunit ribosomal protein L17
MNNKNKISKLGRKTAHRNAMIRNQITSLILFEHMTTTKAKAKALLTNFDRVINIAKNSNKFEVERKLNSILFDSNAVKKTMTVLNSRYAELNSGFVKLYQLGKRKGDNADMVKLMLQGYEYKDLGKEVKSSTKKKSIEEKVVKVEKQTKNVIDNKSSAKMSSQVSSSKGQMKSKSRSGI